MKESGHFGYSRDPEIAIMKTYNFIRTV